MRARIAAVALAASGCNQIFGLSPTDPVPDAPPVLPHVQLRWQIANRRGSEPTTRLEYAPIEPAPAVRVARLGTAWIDATYATDGTIDVPDEFPGTTWRLEYTLDGVPYEIQWSPARNEGQLTIPIAGHLNREPVPPGAGYHLTPTGGPASHPGARIYTTGVWTDGEVTSAGATLDYSFSLARALGGPLGVPDQLAGDIGVLMDVEMRGDCAVGSSSATFDPPAMSTALSTAAPSYSSLAASATVDPGPRLGGQEAGLRLAAALGDRGSQVISVGRTILGHVPSTFIPDFTDPMRGLLPTAAALPGPPLLPVVDCIGLPTAIPLAARPNGLRSFPIAVHIELSDQRTVAGGPVLVSGIAASTTSTTQAYTLDARVPLAIAPITLGSTDLVAADGAAVATTGGAQDLAFGIETGGRVDYYEAVLHEVITGASPQLVRKRVYRSALPLLTTAPRPSVSFDPSVLEVGKQYVFSIHAYLGRPLAFAGDYTRVDYPQGMTTVFTNTFVAR